jgi:hypothetical protein
MLTKEKFDEIRRSRGAIYGDPRENHRGIAQGWAGLLQPWSEQIKRGDPLPEHVVALMMASLKLNRMRRVFHEDNYDDVSVYLAFAEQWQREYMPPDHAYERIYVAGPYSADTEEGRIENLERAVLATALCMSRGHDAHCPHAATHDVHLAHPLGYERWMRLDMGIIERWATALLYLAPSPGADRELALAQSLGLRIYRSISEVEDVARG